MTTENLKEKVLIICNHNSARSQIAEGLLKSLYGENCFVITSQYINNKLILIVMKIIIYLWILKMIS